VRFHHIHLTRVALWVLGAFFAVAALYLVAMNIFLRTKLFRKVINFSPEDMRVEYASAYTLFPGRIHVDGLHIRGSDSMVEWMLVLDHCDFRFWPLDLLRRRFHASHVRGDGLSFRLRLRLKEEDATAHVLQALPPVPGFSDPPYLLIGPPKAPITDAAYNLVSIQLDDVVADHVREIWTQTVRFTGEMRVTGRWLFRPLRWLEVGPASVDVHALNVWYGDHPLATNLHGKIDVTLHPFDVRVPEGLEILEHLSARPELQGSVNIASALTTLTELPGVRFTQGEGPLEVQASVDHGKLEPGSRVDIHLAGAEVDTESLALQAAVAGELRVEKGIDAPFARANLGLSSARLMEEGRTLARASSVSARLFSPNVDLAHFSDDAATFALEVSGVRADSLAPIRSLLPSSGFDVTSGPVTGDGHFEGRFGDSSVVGEVDFTVLGLSMSGERDRLQANVEGHVGLDASSVPDGRAVLTDSRVLFHDIVARVHGVDVAAPSLEAGLGHATVDWRRQDVKVHDVHAALQSVSVARVQDGKRVFEAPMLRVSAVGADMGPNGPSGTVLVELPRGDFPDLPALAESASLPRMLRIERGRGTATVQGAVDLDARSFRGEAHISTQALELRVGSESFASNVSVYIQGRSMNAVSGWPTTDLSGSTVSFTSDDEHAEPWWGRVTAPEAFLRLAGGPAFYARVQIEAKDASPAEALVATITGVPRWLIETASMANLTAEGTIRAAPSLFEVRSLEAHGGSTSVHVEYVRHNGDKQGAALIDTGVLTLGFKLGGSGPGFILFGADSWFKREVTAMRSDPQLLSGRGASSGDGTRNAQDWSNVDRSHSDTRGFHQSAE
jgi:hypothetical protein